MKVLLVNGSPRKTGNTYAGLVAVADQLQLLGIETELIQAGASPVNDCIGCGACRKSGGKCVFGEEDGVNALIEKAAGADGFVFGTPVYYAHPSGSILSLMDRLFYAGSAAFAHKPAAAIACARRAGTTASLDVMNKYFTINQMPVVSSTYWNMVHGAAVGESALDEEGMQTMRNIGSNMAWLLKCIELGKENGVEAPAAEKGKRTNFIR